MNKVNTTKLILILVGILSFNSVQSRIVDTIEALENQSIGEESAPIKMTEFASLTCGHCAKFSTYKKRLY